MQITLNIKETALDEFMQLLKRFPDKDIVIENQAFIEEKARLQKDLNSINNGATMVNDDDLWAGTEKAINNPE